MVAGLISVSIAEAVNFRSLPYMWVADLKILGLMLDPVYLIVVLLVGVVTALIGPLWCRYLCPVGGMYCAVATLSPCSVSRDESTCIQCGKCAKSCHAFCRPDAVRTVRDTECDGCMDCVKVCPVDGASKPSCRTRAHRSVGLAAVGRGAVALDIRRREGERQLGLHRSHGRIQGDHQLWNPRAVEHASGALGRVPVCEAAVSRQHLFLRIARVL